MKFFHIAAMFLLSAAIIIPAAAGSAHGFPLPAAAPGWLQVAAPEPATYLLLAVSIVLLAIAGRAQQRAAAHAA